MCLSQYPKALVVHKYYHKKKVDSCLYLGKNGIACSCSYHASDPGHYFAETADLQEVM